MSPLKTWRAVQADARPRKDSEGIYSQFATGEVQSISTPALGVGGPEFKSRRPDQISVGAMTYRREIFALLHFGTTWKQ